VIDFYDVTNEPRVVVSNIYPYNTLKEGDYLEVDIDKAKEFPYRSVVSSSTVRLASVASSSSSRVYSFNEHRSSFFSSIFGSSSALGNLASDVSGSKKKTLSQ
jgi:hypothetical protein